MRDLKQGAFQKLAIVVALTLSVTAVVSTTAAAQQRDFEQWKQAQKIKRDVFYKQYLKDYNAYKEKVTQRWGDQAEMPSNEKFVDYDDDLNEKLVIDYELGEIRVEMLVDANSEPDEEAVEKVLRRLESESVADTLAASELTRGMQVINNNKVLATFAPNTSVDELAAIAVEEEQVITAVAAPESDKGRTASKAAEPSAADKRIKRYRIKLQGDNVYMQRAKQYEPQVMQHAAEFEVAPDLVFAITQTESSFNPLAQSPIPAFGLMQIVPTSAGLDVNRLVFDIPTMPTEDTLFDASQNIRMGAAYLHLLQTRYLSGIEHPESRLYAVIAAYNTGAGNVASVFHPQGKRQVSGAVKVINTLTPDEVYDRLYKDLPYEETRNYLQKVTTVLPQYQVGS